MNFQDQIEKANKILGQNQLDASQTMSKLHVMADWLNRISQDHQDIEYLDMYLSGAADIINIGDL